MPPRIIRDVKCVVCAGKDIDDVPEEMIGNLCSKHKNHFMKNRKNSKRMIHNG